MKCEEVATQAAGLAALAPTDPERQAAFAHARTCDACRRALREGEAMLSLLDRAAPAEAPSRATLETASKQILDELAAARREERARVRRVGWAIPLAVLAAWALPFALSSTWRNAEPLARATTLSLALSAVVAGAGAATLGGIGAALPVLLSLAAAGVYGQGSGLGAGVGLRCAAFELALAVLPAAVAIVLARRSLVPAARSRIAGGAAAGALAGQALLHVSCHATQSHAHLLVFHAGGVLLALALAGVAARFTRTAT